MFRGIIKRDVTDMKAVGWREWEGDVDSGSEGWEGLEIGERRGIGIDEMEEGGRDKDIMMKRRRGEG